MGYFDRDDATVADDGGERIPVGAHAHAAHAAARAVPAGISGPRRALGRSSPGVRLLPPLPGPAQPPQPLRAVHAAPPAARSEILPPAPAPMGRPVPSPFPSRPSPAVPIELVKAPKQIIDLEESYPSYRSYGSYQPPGSSASYELASDEIQSYVDSSLANARAAASALAAMSDIGDAPAAAAIDVVNPKHESAKVTVPVAMPETVPVDVASEERIPLPMAPRAATFGGSHAGELTRTPLPAPAPVGMAYPYAQTAPIPVGPVAAPMHAAMQMPMQMQMPPRTTAPMPMPMTMTSAPTRIPSARPMSPAESMQIAAMQAAAAAQMQQLAAQQSGMAPAMPMRASQLVETEKKEGRFRFLLAGLAIGTVIILLLGTSFTSLRSRLAYALLPASATTAAPAEAPATATAAATTAAATAAATAPATAAAAAIGPAVGAPHAATAGAGTAATTPPPAFTVVLPTIPAWQAPPPAAHHRRHVADDDDDDDVDDRRVAKNRRHRRSSDDEGGGDAISSLQTVDTGLLNSVDKSFNTTGMTIGSGGFMPAQ